MEQIREGKLFPKTTRPDVCDNLKKLVLDSMSELVYSDDSIIWGEDNVRKFFGTGGCVIIEIEGK
jgi:Holliday junction resolvase RusA-like endonuclease